MKTMNADQRHREDSEDQQQQRIDRAGAGRFQRLADAVAGKRATMPAKMISEMPLPTPRLVICSPIHIRRMVPPVSVIIGGDAEEEARMDHDMAPMLQADGDAIGLDRGQATVP